MGTVIALIKVPPLGLIVGVATGCTGALTVRVKVVVFVNPPLLALTVTVEVPAVVAPLVDILRIVEHVGVQETAEKDPVVPEGKPETLKEVGWALPDINVALMELLTDEPAVTDRSPTLEIT
jgi:hypothetical protein